MGEANAGPDEEEGETGEREQPGEDDVTVSSVLQEGGETEGELDEDIPERTTFLIDVDEKLRAHAADGKCLHGAGRGEGAGVCDREDGNRDHGVEC